MILPINVMVIRQVISYVMLLASLHMLRTARQGEVSNYQFPIYLTS